jgi:hypothetical protein
LGTIDPVQKNLPAHELTLKTLTCSVIQPDIGVNKMRPKLDRDEHEFVNRLAYSHYEREHRLEVLRQHEDTGYDKKTGQPLFQPVTGRGPIYERNTGGLPIGEYLFASRYEFDDIKVGGCC